MAPSNVRKHNNIDAEKKPDKIENVEIYLSLGNNHDVYVIMIMQQKII